VNQLNASSNCISTQALEKMVVSTRFRTWKPSLGETARESPHIEITSLCGVRHRISSENPARASLIRQLVPEVLSFSDSA
jgi:hypothetical protein